MKRLKIGYVGMIQKNFTGDKAAVRERSLRDLAALCDAQDVELYVYPEAIVAPEDAERARAAIDAERVDLALLQNTSFCSGYLVQILARADAAIGLWAVPETTQTGPMPLNSFCGINIGAALIRSYLRAYPIRYKWFYGYGEDDMFAKRLTVTIQALRALKNLRGARIGHVGGIAPGFDNFYDDERLIESRLGVKVDRHIEFEDIASRARSYADADLQPLVDEMIADAAHVEDYAKDYLFKYARTLKAYRDLAQERGLSALASTCWPRYRTELSMVPCLTFARLTDEGLLTACEGDVLSAASMLALRYLADDTPTLMDLSEVDPADGTINLWHCGVGSRRYARGGRIGVERHFNPGPYSERTGWAIQAPVASMEFTAGRATVLRFTNECQSAFVMGGNFFEGKPSHDGSRGWMRDLSFNGESISLPDLMNTILVNGFHHHYPLVHGDWTAQAFEMMYWMGLTKLPKVPYADGNVPGEAAL